MAVYWREGKRRLSCFIAYKARGRKVREKVGHVATDVQVKAKKALKRKATAVLDQRLVEVGAGTWKPPAQRQPAEQAQPLRFRQLVDRFLRDYQSKRGNIAYYGEQARAWLKYLPVQKLASEVSVADVDRFRRKRAAKVSPSTVRKGLVSLSTLFRWAKARGLVSSNPADFMKVKRPSEPKHNARYLTEDQEKLLVAKSPGWLRPIIRFAIQTGMDKSEIIELTWRDIDTRADVIIAPRSKTGAPRELPILDKVAIILDDARAVRRIDTDRVFLGRDGGPIHPEAAKAALRRAYDAAGLTGGWKTLRHTFGSRSAMSGMDSASIAKLMGHTNQAVTGRYMHLSPAHLREALGKLENWSEKKDPNRGPKKGRKTESAVNGL